MADNACYALRFPQDEDVWDLVNHLRQSDRDELEAMYHYPPEEAIIKSLQSSDAYFTRAAHVDGKLACIFGCSPRTPSSAAPWLLCTDVVNDYSKTLTRDTRDVIKRMLERYPVLSNYVDQRNTKTIAWLQFLGFTMKETVILKSGFPFYYFEMRAVCL